MPLLTLNEDELNRIKGMMHYLAQQKGGVDFDVKVIDPNGETLGLILKEDNAYVFQPGDGS